MFAINESDSDKRWIRIIYAVFMLFVFVVIARGISLRTVADDDLFFSTALEGKTLLGYLVARYNSWSGRFILEAITVSTINIKIFWKLAIPGLFLLICYSIWKLTLKTVFSVYIGHPLVVLMLLLLSGGVLRDGGWWVTGFYNYLLPISLGFFAFSVVVYKDDSSLLMRCLSFVAVAICCQHEQAAIAFISGVVFVALSRKRLGKNVSYEVLLLIVGLVSCFVLFAAPGNYNRLFVELHWLPEFSQMNFVEKLMLGFDRFSYHLNDVDNKLTLLLVLVSGMATLKTKRCWGLKPVVVMILGVFVFNVLLKQAGLAHYSDKLGNLGFVSPENWHDYDIFFQYTFTILLYGTLIASAMYISEDFYEGVKLIGTLILALILVMAVSFSPTVYASSARILYLSDALWVVYSCLLLRKLIGEHGSMSLLR